MIDDTRGVVELDFIDLELDLNVCENCEIGALTEKLQKKYS